jgi:hypothetical protein
MGSWEGLFSETHRANFYRNFNLEIWNQFLILSLFIYYYSQGADISFNGATAFFPLLILVMEF